MLNAQVNEGTRPLQDGLHIATAVLQGRRPKEEGRVMSVVAPPSPVDISTLPSLLFGFPSPFSEHGARSRVFGHPYHPPCPPFVPCKACIGLLLGDHPIHEVGIDDLLNRVNKRHWWWLVSFPSRPTYPLWNGAQGYLVQILSRQ